MAGTTEIDLIKKENNHRILLFTLRKFGNHWRVEKIEPKVPVDYLVRIKEKMGQMTEHAQNSRIACTPYNDAYADGVERVIEELQKLFPREEN